MTWEMESNYARTIICQLMFWFHRNVNNIELVNYERVSNRLWLIQPKDFASNEWIKLKETQQVRLCDHRVQTWQ